MEKKLILRLWGEVLGGIEGEAELACFLQGNHHKKHPSLRDQGKGGFVMIYESLKGWRV